MVEEQILLGELHWVDQAVSVASRAEPPVACLALNLPMPSADGAAHGMP